MEKPQHPWLERNLKDHTTSPTRTSPSYLYNNWVPGLAKPEDREKVIRGRLAVEDRLATKFAKALESTSNWSRSCSPA